MHYLIVTKLEYPTSISLKVKGLRSDESKNLRYVLREKNIKHKIDADFLEAEITGVEMLNMLADESFGYRVVGQAMAMEHSNLGGRSFQIEKVIWTLESNV